MIPQLSEVCYAVKSMFHISNTETFKTIYFACSQSVMKYRKIIGHNFAYSKNRYLLYKRKLLELWLLQNLEIHAGACLRI
jgi:hypothetical protein